MNNEQLIAQAILELKQENSLIKEYIFPIAMALFSSFIGALLGYLVFHRQEKISAEKLKLDNINKWILLADQIHQSLIAIKFNYHDRLNNDPYKRIFAVPSILLNEENFKFEYHELVFISAIQKKKWSNIPYLRTLFSNYPSLLSMWQMRNNLNDKIRSQIFEASNQNTAYIDLSDKQIQELANQSDLACLIDITEHVIRLTDDLIVEFHNFLNEFPEVAKKKINLKLIKNYGIILKYDSSDNKNIELILKESPLPDYEKLSFILGRSESELMARYSPLFRK